MGSRIFIFLGLLLAVALLFSSEVADARDLAETSSTHNYKKADATYEKASSTNDVEDVKHGGKEGHPDQICYGPYGCCHGCCLPTYLGCGRCCNAGEVPLRSAKAQSHN